MVRFSPLPPATRRTYFERFLADTVLISVRKSASLSHAAELAAPEAPPRRNSRPRQGAEKECYDGGTEIAAAVRKR